MHGEQLELYVPQAKHSDGQQALYFAKMALATAVVTVVGVGVALALAATHGVRRAAYWAGRVLGPIAVKTVSFPLFDAAHALNNFSRRTTLR